MTQIVFYTQKHKASAAAGSAPKILLPGIPFVINYADSINL